MSQSVAIISASITVFALVLSIFGASWLNQRNVERPLEQLEKRFDARFDTLMVEIKRLDQRIDSLERNIGQRIDSVEQRIGGVEQRLDRIDRQLEAIFQPVLPER